MTTSTYEERILVLFLSVLLVGLLAFGFLTLRDLTNRQIDRVEATLNRSY